MLTLFETTPWLACSVARPSVKTPFSLSRLVTSAFRYGSKKLPFVTAFRLGTFCGGARDISIQ